MRLEFRPARTGDTVLCRVLRTRPEQIRVGDRVLCRVMRIGHDRTRDGDTVACSVLSVTGRTIEGVVLEVVAPELDNWHEHNTDTIHVIGVAVSDSKPAGWESALSPGRALVLAPAELG